MPLKGTRMFARASSLGLTSALSALGSGLFTDLGLSGLAMALAFVSLLSLCTLMLNYLNGAYVR